MPWDSFRKKRLANASPASKRKDRSGQQAQQIDHNHRGNEQTPSSSTSSSETVTNSKDTKNRHQTQSGRLEAAVGNPPRTGTLSHEVYQRIKSVDQESSTLTAAGAEGLSARVQERYECTQPSPDGALRTFICQTIELIKRPGQSLGLYLREGNGLDRFDGVFVSRLADGFDLQKSGVLNSGDEILSVNGVNVARTSIDEVVVMISIPRRLLLRTQTVKGLSSAIGIGDLDNAPGDLVAVNKPIAVLKQMPREESRESCLTDDGTPLVSQQLIATAHTSLGVKARQQESAYATSVAAESPSFASNHSSQMAAPTSGPVPPRHPHAPPQRSFSDRWSYNRQLAMHIPRLLDAEGRPLSDAPVGPFGVQNDGCNMKNTSTWRDRDHIDQRAFMVPSSSATVVEAATDPLQRFEGQDQTPASVGIATSSAFMTPTNSGLRLWTTSSINESSGSQASAGYGGLGTTPRSVLRHPSSVIGTSSETSADQPTSFVNKSNSLPRRQPGRTIKWRADLQAAKASANSNAAYYYSSDMSDSDGTVSAPEFPMSPPSRGVPQPVYPLPRQLAGKTVDDIFSRAEYQAWARSSPYNNRLTGSSTERPQGRCGQYSQSNSTTGFASARRIDAIYENPVPTNDHNWRSHDAKGKNFLDHSDGGISSMEDQSSVAFQCRPIPPPRISRPTRSSSLPPKGVLTRAMPTANGGTFDQPVTNATGSEDIRERLRKLGNGTETRYNVDVSPLPQRRIPLALAAANPAFGYTADGPTNALGASNGGNSVVALSGLLIIRVIDGRGLRVRDPEELYCVLEVDGEHRARTEVRDWRSAFRWDETFEVDVWDCRQTDFYIYSWHSQYRHRLRHHASLQLVDVLLNMTKFDLNEDVSPPLSKMQPSSRSFVLNLDPRGQLFIQISFRPMASTYRRTLANSRSSYFGTPLSTLIERESSGAAGLRVPVVLRRLIQEIERRGVDTGGLYVLCGSQEKKRTLKDALEMDPLMSDVSADVVPDLNILTSVLKDFLRELPEPLVPHLTFQMLLEAWKACVANEKEDNARKLLAVIDCLPIPNKCTLTLLLDHFKVVISQSPHNGLSTTKCSVIFGPLIFCTSQAFPISNNIGSDFAFGPLKSYVSFLDHRLAARLLEVLLELWPARKSVLGSSTLEYSAVLSNTNGHAVDSNGKESNC